MKRQTLLLVIAGESFFMAGVCFLADFFGNGFVGDYVNYFWLLVLSFFSLSLAAFFPGKDCDN